MVFSEARNKASAMKIFLIMIGMIAGQVAGLMLAHHFHLL